MEQKSSEQDFQEKKNSFSKRGKRKSRSFFSSGITVLSRTTSPGPDESGANHLSGTPNASSAQNSPANPQSNANSSNSPQTSLSPRKRSSTISSLSEKDISEVLKSSPNNSPNSKLSPSNRDESNSTKYSKIMQIVSKKENTKKVLQAQKYARGYLARQMLSFRKQVAKQRKELVEQLYDSEKLYSEALRLLVSHFLVPLRLHTYSGKNLPGNEQRGKQLELQHLRTIFGDIEVILNLSAKLESQLEARLKDWSFHTSVGDLFIQISDYIKLYFTYASNYPKAYQTIQSLRASTKAFENLLKEYQHHTECSSFFPSFEKLLNFVATFQFSSSNDSTTSPPNKLYIGAGGIDLESLLFIPIERMSQYEFALTEMENNTWKEHPDYVTLHKALDKFTLANFSSHLSSLKTSDGSSQTNSPSVEENKRDTLTGISEEPPSAKLFAQNLFRIHSVKKRLLGKYEELIVPGRTILLEGSVVYSNSFIEPDFSSLGSGSMETTKSNGDQNSSSTLSNSSSSFLSTSTTSNNTPSNDRSNLTSSKGKGNNNNNGTFRASVDRESTVSPAPGVSSSSIDTINNASNNGKHSMYIFLFSDIIVFGKLIQLKDTSQSYYKFKKLRSLGVVSVESTVSPLCLRMNIDKKSRYLYFETETEKKKWISILNKAIYSFIRLEKKKAHQEKIQDIRKSFSLAAFASGSQDPVVDSESSTTSMNGTSNSGPRMKRTQSLSKFLSLPKKSNNPVTRVQDISMPYNVRHSLHVDKDLNWSGQDPDSAFEKVELIGEGSYGTVWCIKHKASGALLAAKIIQKQEFSVMQQKQKQQQEQEQKQKSPAEEPSNVYVHEIENEINILRKCKNANIVSYYGTCSTKDSIWILMDYCRLGSVRDIMSKTRKTITEEQIGQIVQDVLKGLVYLHASGIIHRDLKAGNLLMNELGQVMIADFGVSKITDKTNELIGTPVYMSPEVVLKQGYDNKTDIWSLGIIMIELADGYPPLYKLPPKRAMQMIPIRTPPTFQNPKMWSSNMLNFLSQCLVKDPTKRASAIDLLAHPFVQGAKGHKYTTMKLVQELELMKKHEKYIMDMQQQQQQKHQAQNADSESSANSSRNSLGSVQDNQNPVPNVALPNDPNIKEGPNNAMKPLQMLADKLNKVAHQSAKEEEGNNYNNHVTHNTLNTNPNISNNISNNNSPANNHNANVNNSNNNTPLHPKSRSRSVSTPKKKASEKQLTASVSFEGPPQNNANSNANANAIGGGTIVIKDSTPAAPAPSPVSKSSPMIIAKSNIESSGTIVLNEIPSETEAMSTFVPKQNVPAQVTTKQNTNTTSPATSTLLSSQKVQRTPSNSNLSTPPPPQQSISRTTTPVPDAMGDLADSIARNIQIALEKTLNSLAIPESLKNLESSISAKITSELSQMKEELVQEFDSKLKEHELRMTNKFEEMLENRINDSQSNSRKSPSVWTNSNRKITDFFKPNEGKFNTVQRSHSYNVLRRNRSNSSASVNERVKLFQGFSGNKV